MKKRILSLVTMVCLALSLAACGGGNAAQETTSNGEEQTATTENTSDSDLPTLEGYFNSDAMQTVISAVKEQYEEQGISAKMYAEGNELRYEFTMSDIETTEEERPDLEEALKASTEANAQSYMDTAKQAKDAVSNEEVIVVLTFLDGAGNVLYTQSFSSADAE